MKLNYLALILLIGVVPSCRQPAAPTPEQSTTKAAPVQTPAAKTEPPAATATEKRAPQLPKLPEMTSEAKAFLENQRAEFGGSSLPQNFPRDVPIYTGAEVKGGGRMGRDLAITLWTADSPAAVSEFYQKELPRRGWKVPVPKFSGSTVEARKPGRECTIGIDPDMMGQGTLIGIMVTPETKE